MPRALPHRGAARAAFPFVLLPLFCCDLTCWSHAAGRLTDSAAECVSVLPILAVGSIVAPVILTLSYLQVGWVGGAYQCNHSMGAYQFPVLRQPANLAPADRGRG